MSTQPLNVEQIFKSARGKTDPGERAAYLEGACGNDVGLRAKVEALLAADAEDGTFLQIPGDMVDPDATLPPIPRGARSDRGRRGGAVSSEQPGGIIGRYKLLQEIGEGGFGSVWMAEQREPVKRRVALKVIKLGMDTKQVIARFEAERQALAMMDHPNIAKVFDAGSTETGRPFFVMEYVKGIGILEYCDTEKLPTKKRLELFINVCHAIQHAHQKGIIHRDIKPTNVLVTLHDGMPVPKVIDFGIAKATNAALTEKTLFTEHRQMIGTPAYMSPEQAEMSGLDIDTRADIYSLGVLLYELLTGTTPFDSKELTSKGYAEMLRIIRDTEPEKPSTRLSTLGDTATHTAEQRHVADPKKLGLILRGDLDWIVMKCLEKDRSCRYETANGLAMDIKRHLNNEPVVAGRPSVFYRARKFIRRNKTGAVAGCIVFAAILTGLGVAGVGFIRARIANERLSKAIVAEQAERERAEDAEALAEARAERIQVALSEAETARGEAETARGEAETARHEAERVAYSSSLGAAVAAIESNDAKSAKAFLSQTPEALRGWEHDLLLYESDRSLDQKRFTPERVSERGQALHTEMHPDASLAVIRGRQAKGSDSLATVMELATEKIVSNIPLQSGFEKATLISPNKRYIGLGITSLTAMNIFDLKEGKFVFENGWPRNDSMLAFSPDSSRAIISKAGGRVGVVSLPSGEIEWTTTDLPLAHGPNEARFSPDGRMLIVGGGEEGTTLVVDAETFDVIARLQEANPIDISFSADGSLVALAATTLEGMATYMATTFAASVYDTSTWTMLYEVLPGGGARATAVCFFRRPFDEHDRLAIGRDDGVIQVVHARTGRPADELRGQSGAIRSIAYDADTRRIVSASDTGSFYWWDGLRTTIVPTTHPGDEVAFIDGGVVALADLAPRAFDRVPEWADHPVLQDLWHRSIAARLYDHVLGRELDALYSTPVSTSHVVSVSGYALSPDGRRLATSEGNAWGGGRLRVYDLWTGEALYTAHAHKPSRDGKWDARRLTFLDAEACAWSPDGSLIAAVSSWNTPMLFDAETYELVGPMWNGTGDNYNGHRDKVLEVRFTPDGSTLISTDSNGGIIGWNVSERAKAWEIALGAEGANAWSLDVAADGSMAVVGAATGLVVIFNPATGEELSRFTAHTGQVAGVWFDNDGARLVTSGDEIKIWDTSDFSEIVTLRQGSQNLAQLSPDGRTFVSKSIGLHYRFIDVRPEAEAAADRRSAFDALAIAQPVVERLDRETGGDTVEMRRRIESNANLSKPVRRAALSELRLVIDRRLALAYDVRTWVPRVLPIFDRWFVEKEPLTWRYFWDPWPAGAADEAARRLASTSIEEHAIRELTIAMRGLDFNATFDTLVLASAWRLLLLNESSQDAEIVAERLARSLAEDEPFAEKALDDASDLRFLLGLAHLRAGRADEAITVLDESGFESKTLLDTVRALALHAAGRTDEAASVYADVRARLEHPEDVHRVDFVEAFRAELDAAFPNAADDETAAVEMPSSED